jgi:putative DNA modification/repair radical SAM protein
MGIAEKLRILADAAKYDASCASSGAVRKGRADGLGSADGSGICHSYTPDGRCVSLLRILLTNQCVWDCAFCVNRASNDIPRARFTPEEIVTLTLDFYRRNYIEGLFLSSGVLRDPDTTVEQMVRTARLLRETHRFNGYVHLKLVPGVSSALIAEAGRWADRVSTNVELPTQRDLDALAPEKRMDTIEAVMSDVALRARASRDERRESERAPVFAPAGQTTQMVVGATAATDAQILATASRLYARHGLRRVYYSAFSPIPGGDDRLAAIRTPLVREHRLYQADWLIRHYGFTADELTSPAAPDLDLVQDPKLTWAMRHPEFYPVDVNTAPREALLRVPGIGYRTVERILMLRRRRKIALADLVKLRAVVSRAKRYIITADHCPGAVFVAPGRTQRRSRASQLQLPGFGVA